MALNNNNRKAIFAAMEQKRKDKEAQIVVTMSLKDWEAKDEKE